MRKQSSNNIKFKNSPNLPLRVEEITNMLYDFFKSLLYCNMSRNFFDEIIEVGEDYLGNKHEVYIQVYFDDNIRLGLFQTNPWGIDYIYVYVICFFNAYSITKENIVESEDYLKKKIKSVILHELTHVVDPKMQKTDMSNIEMGENNLGTEMEFDAYCQEICFEIANELKKEDDLFLKEIMIWIKSGKIMICPDFLRVFLPVFEVWNNDEKLKKRFFERVYNELTEDGKNIFAKFKYESMIKISSANHGHLTWLLKK